MTTLTAPATDGAQRDLSAVDLLRPEASLRRMHPAQDVIDGVLWYGVPVDDALVAITSSRQAYRADRLPDGIALRARAARLRALYDFLRTRFEPVRHGSAELLLEARALRSRLAAAQLAELRRRHHQG